MLLLPVILMHSVSLFMKRFQRFPSASNAINSGIADELPASVAQWAEAQCAPAGTVCRRGGVQSPGRPADFVFGFQGRML